MSDGVVLLVDVVVGLTQYLGPGLGALGALGALGDGPPKIAKLRFLSGWILCFMDVYGRYNMI